MTETQDNENGNYRSGASGRYSTLEVEIKRLDQLRTADQLALVAALATAEKAVAAALAAAEKAVAAALESAEKAIAKAETAQQRVNETQNEFRGTLRDQARELMPRNETENLIRELRTLITAGSERTDAQMDNLQRQIGDMRSRLDVGPPSLATLRSRSDQETGRGAGALDTRTLILAILAGVATLLAIAQALGPT